MTWDELEKVAENAICSELGNIPKTMAARVAKRIVEDVRISFAAADDFYEGIQLIQEPDNAWSVE